MQISCLQHVSSSSIKSNINQIEKEFSCLSSDSKLVVLPENVLAMTRHEREKLQIAETLGDGVMQESLRELAIRYNQWIVAGTVPIKSELKDKIYAMSIVYDSNGNQVATYAKKYLFDVTVSDKESYLESDVIQSGEAFPKALMTPVGRLGIAICYDLRFAEIFLSLVEQGVDVIVIPSAFTYHTGQQHWDTLIRARAIETQSYVVGCNQGGVHENKRRTFGHSCIYDPYGRMLAQIESGIGIIQAKIDMEVLNAVRSSMPMDSSRQNYA